MKCAGVRNFKVTWREIRVKLDQTGHISKPAWPLHFFFFSLIATAIAVLTIKEICTFIHVKVDQVTFIKQVQY